MAMLRAYLLQSTYDWLNKHDLTPYLLVDAEEEGVLVPEVYVEDGQIVLNIAPSAIQSWDLNNNLISFDASFNGEVYSIEVPVQAVLGLYAEETSQGVYAHEHGLGLIVNEGEASELDPKPEDKSKKVAPFLRVVK